MRGLRQDALAALDPVRAALHAAAQAAADEIEARAAEEVVDILTTAHREAEDVITTAAAQGTAAAMASAALRSARVRREANELVLGAQETLRRELADQVILAAQDLRGDPRYASWVDQLGRYCRDMLGPQATVTPSPSGGVVGELDSRRLDLSIPVLAAAAVAANGAQMRQLWTP